MSNLYKIPCIPPVRLAGFGHGSETRRLSAWAVGVCFYGLQSSRDWVVAR
jgi:hypothetical protein